MVDIQYKKSCVEILEILKHISKEDYKKIPKNIIRVLETDKDNNYYFEYNVNKTLDEQNVSKQAKVMIALFFRDYWANERQKEIIVKNEKVYRNKLEEEKKAKYNPDNIFKNRVSNVQQVAKEDVSMVEYKESIFVKIRKWLGNIFKLK